MARRRQRAQLARGEPANEHRREFMRAVLALTAGAVVCVDAGKELAIQLYNPEGHAQTFLAAAL